MSSLCFLSVSRITSCTSLTVRRTPFGRCFSRALVTSAVSFLAILVVAVLIAYNLIGQIRVAFKSGDRLSLAAEQIIKLEIKNKELKKRLAEVKSAGFLEQQIRDKLGLVKEGETLVVIPQAVIDQVLALNQKVEKVRLPNPLGWWRLFFK